VRSAASRYDADVLVLDGDPLADIEIIAQPARITGVWKAGVGSRVSRARLITTTDRTHRATGPGDVAPGVTSKTDSLRGTSSMAVADRPPGGGRRGPAA
jgi:hypothetical protein